MTGRRIAVAGVQHETNTFAPFTAGVDEFAMADSWPGLLWGDAVIDGTRGMNLPIAGAIARAEEDAADVVPILWCAAEPSGPVTDEAFDWIAGMIADGLAAAGPIDGVYLDLHGAMVTQSHHDGEAALLARIRQQVGADVPIAVSLDLHANLSAEVVARTQAIAIYRTYPHLDMAATGRRAMAELLRCLASGPRKAAFRPVPFLVPLHAQFTGADPCRNLYGLLDERNEPDGAGYADLAMGFTASDVPDCGPSVVAYADTQADADARADRMLAAVRASEREFDATLHSPDAAVRQAMAVAGPVILADVQDNPGAGAASDTTGILSTLVQHRAQGAVLGVVHDPRIAARAQDLGVGARLDGDLGGRFGRPGSGSFGASFRVLAISDGRIAYTGEMYGGGIAEVGPSCLLAVDIPGVDIKIVVSSVRTQCLDQAFFTHFGVDPADAQIVCVKSTVHFRADFDPIARAVINVKSPGLFPCDLAEVRYTRVLRPPARAVPVPRPDP